MKLSSKKSGFTLLEIIIVIIIVGVLASLALPRFFSTIEYSRSVEALSSLQGVRGAMERCFLQTGTYVGCGLGSLDIGDPADAAGSHFEYTITRDGATAGFTITATRNTIDGSQADGNIIWLHHDNDNGVTKGGDGSYGGIQ